MHIPLKWPISSSPGFASQVLDSLDEENVVLLVKLQTALGQAIGSIYQGSLAASAQAFETALSVSLFFDPILVALLNLFIHEPFLCTNHSIYNYPYYITRSFGMHLLLQKSKIEHSYSLFIVVCSSF